MTPSSRPQDTLEVTHAPAAPAPTPPVGAQPLAVAGAPAAFPTYACRAEHARLHPVARAFDTFVPMVRVSLGEHDTPELVTPIGVVKRSDHLLFSVAEVRAQFGAALERPVARVEMITPARRLGSRFSPIALLFGYERETDAAPSFFIVEAGTADGKPKVLYLAPRMDAELLYVTGYQPTPLSSPEQIYRSRMTMAGPDEPGELVIEAMARLEAAPHLRITARFERETLARTPLPIALTAEAAVRVMAVARDVGVDVGGALGRVLGGLAGAGLAWRRDEDEEPAPSSRAA